MKRLSAVILASTLALTGCSLFGGNENDPDPDASPTYDVDPDDLPDSENPPIVNKLTLDGPTEDLGRYSLEELSGAQAAVQTYINNSLTSDDLLSGEWWAEGHNMKRLTELGEFSEDLNKDITALTPTNGIGAQATQSLALFLTETDTVKATEQCKTEGHCSGEPFYSNATWTATNDDVVHVAVSASVVRPLLKNEEETHSIDTYNYSVHLSYHEAESEWEINELKNSYTIGKETDG